MRQSIHPDEKPEFNRARILAYKLLLKQRRPHIGMLAEKVVIPGKKLVFDTLQNYSRATNTCMYDLTVDGKITLGCHVDFASKVYLLLHNADINSEQCKNWTDIHEIGHICLGHEKNGDKEEVEANFFAACFLMPDPVLRFLECNGCEITKKLLVNEFNVSPGAATKKINTLRKGDFLTDLDGEIKSAMYCDIREILNQDSGFSEFINFVTLDLL